MPVQNFTVPGGNCPAGQKTVSASTLVDNNPRSLFIRLTSTEWDAKVGLGGGIWGIEISLDGVAWERSLNQAFVFGQRGKDGLLPAMQVGGGTLATWVGQRARLFADLDPGPVGIQLGAQVAVTTA